MSLENGRIDPSHNENGGYPEEIPAIWDNDSAINRKLQKKKAKLRFRRPFSPIPYMFALGGTVLHPV